MLPPTSHTYTKKRGVVNYSEDLLTQKITPFNNLCQNILAVIVVKGTWTLKCCIALLNYLISVYYNQTNNSLETKGTCYFTLLNR